MSQHRYCVCIVVLLSLFVAGSHIALAAEPERIPLWSEGAPGAATKPDDEPALTVFRPAEGTATGTGIVICPGGGYGHLAFEKEGTKFAEWLNSFGVTACVLRYRHGGTGHKHPIPMQDGQRAIRIVRSRASELGVDPHRIGVMGFSAGGHLASTLGTHFDAGQPEAADPIDRTSSRPDFLILCYPVISLTAPYTHTGSRDNLLGKNADPKLVGSLSNEFQVTPETPPTFIFQTNEDGAVPAENALSFYAALRRAGVPAEIHVYERGGHGVGLAKDIPGTRDWPDRLQAWLGARGLLKHATN